SSPSARAGRPRRPKTGSRPSAPSRRRGGPGSSSAPACSTRSSRGPSRRGSALADRRDRIADRDLSVLEDVRAQAAAMDERAQNGARRVALDDGARLTEAHAAAPDGADRELPAHEPVEVDASRDEVAAVLLGAKRRVEGLADLRVDEGERAAG